MDQTIKIMHYDRAPNALTTMRLIVRIRDIIGLFSLSVICNVTSAQWQPITEPLGEFEQYLNMCFTNDSTGYVLYQLYDPDTLYHKVLKTTDYGLTWNSILDIAQENNTLSNYLKDIFFINEEIGWICGVNMPYILKTLNGGDNWFPILLTEEQDFKHIKFATENYGLALGGDAGGTTIETSDGGLTWSLNPNFNGQQVSFNDSCNFVVASGNARLNVDCNYEFLEIADSEIGINYNCRSVHCINNDHWILGSLGLIGFNNIGSIITTYDGGQSFLTLDLFFTSAVSDFYFLSEDIGFTVVTPINDIPCYLLKTTDGGISWSCQETPIVISQFGESYYAYFYDMDLRNENLTYAMDQNSIYRTTNGGGPLGDTYTGVKVLANKARTLNIYPNPTSSIVRLELSDASEVKAIEIYNSVGQQVEIFNGRIQTIDVSLWSAGCYTVVVRYENEVIRQRLVVE